MFRFRLRGRPAAGLRARLSFETLDGRVLLDATPLVAPDPPLTSDVAPNPSPPAITSFTAVEVAPGWYRFTGTVSAEHPEGMVVSLGGEPNSVQGETATVGADGIFSVLIQMRTDGTDDGTVTAVTSDANGTSNTAMTDVTPSH
jgi:hypothetical protein